MWLNDIERAFEDVVCGSELERTWWGTGGPSMLIHREQSAL